MRRLINNFPYHRSVQYIKYKAAWISIRTLEISEADTSNTCFNCRTKDKKAKHKDCSNVVMNILQRGVGILSTLGGFLTYSELSMIIERNKMIMKEHVSSEMKEPSLL
jgi:transposase